MASGPCLLVWPFWLLIIAASPLSAAVRLQVVEGRPVVDGVFVNGHGPYRFLVDTAATSNHMEPGLAHSIGLTANFRTALTSSVGEVMAPGRDGVEIELGGAHADAQTVLFAGMQVVHQLASGIQGILGQEFLSRFDYLLDLRGKHIEFGKQDLRGRRSAFQMQNGRAAVSTSLGNLVLDSGAANLILFGVNPDGAESNYMKTLAGSKLVGMVYRSLVIGGQRFWDGHAVAIPDQAEPGVAGLMPLSLFRTIYVCNSEGYVIFE